LLRQANDELSKHNQLLWERLYATDELVSSLRRVGKISQQDASELLRALGVFTD
jgi:hypothetical protein